MIEITIKKDNKKIQDELFPIALENLIRSSGKFVDKKSVPCSTSEFFKYKGNLLGSVEEIYEVSNRGIIRYTAINNLLQKYLAIINLEGFNEKEDYVWNLKSKLEKIASAKSKEEIIEFLPEVFFKKD